MKIFTEGGGLIDNFFLAHCSLKYVVFYSPLKYRLPQKRGSLNPPTHYTPNLGLSVMLLSGAEVVATSVPDKSMTLIPKLAVFKQKYIT